MICLLFLRRCTDASTHPHRLEIGAGGGLVGLAVAKGCDLRQPLYITDQLEMLSLMGHNVVLNEMEGQVKPLILNWFVLRPLSPDFSILPRPCISGTLAQCDTASLPSLSRSATQNHVLTTHHIV